MDITTLAKNFRGHLRTVNQHRKMVLKHCIKAGIPIRGLLHDLSKYSPTEFIPGVLYFQGNRSPNEKEREISGYSKAWMHHKGRNRHHFEYWTDYSTVTKKWRLYQCPISSYSRCSVTVWPLQRYTTRKSIPTICRWITFSDPVQKGLSLTIPQGSWNFC